jgi:hypothetical protein
MGLLLAAVVGIACGPKGTTMKTNDEPVARLKQHLAQARQHSAAYTPEAIPERDAVRAEVASETRPWWEALSPEENFLLFELIPELAEKAQPEIRARAYCAGLASISPEWWGLPSGPGTATAQRLVQLGKAAARCLRDSLQSTTPLRYLDGEANAMAQSYGWSVADLAAAIAAQILSESYDAMASSDARAARRIEFAALLQ